MKNMFSFPQMLLCLCKICVERFGNNEVCDVEFWGPCPSNICATSVENMWRPVSHFCNSIYDTFWENGARRCAAVVQAGKCRHNLGSRRKTENSNKPEVEQLKISSSAEIRTKSKTPEKWLKFLIHSNGIAPTWTISTELHASKGKGRLVTTFVPV